MRSAAPQTAPFLNGLSIIPTVLNAFCTDSVQVDRFRGEIDIENIWIWAPGGCRVVGREHSCLTQRGFKAVLHKSIPTKIRQLILYISNDEG